MNYPTVIFDFDGTLADTQSVLRDVFNSLAELFGFEPLADSEIPALRSMRARDILTKRLHISPWNVVKIVRLERATRWAYVERAQEITLFPGIAPLLNDLKRGGYRIGIVSSGDANIIRAALSRESVTVDFLEAGIRVFGKARALRRALRCRRISAKEAVYIGDELRDIEAARSAQVPMIAVGWGLNTPEALRAAGATVAMTPEELRTALANGQM